MGHSEGMYSSVEVMEKCKHFWEFEISNFGILGHWWFCPVLWDIKDFRCHSLPFKLNTHNFCFDPRYFDWCTFSVFVKLWTAHLHIPFTLIFWVAAISACHLKILGKCKKAHIKYFRFTSDFSLRINGQYIAKIVIGDQ